MGPWSLELGKDPWKLTWVGLLLLSNLFQAAQQGIDVGLDLRQLCLDGLQLTALYWSRGSTKLSPGSSILTQGPSPILSSRKRGQWQELSLSMAFSGQGKGQSCLQLPLRLSEGHSYSDQPALLNMDLSPNLSTLKGTGAG